jgi:transcriptional regulator with XRE-family HTH domain
MAPELNKIDKDLKVKIAMRFKELREQSGKSQTGFALSYEKDKQAQHRLESGRGASIYSINRFCIALGIPLISFFDSPIFNEHDDSVIE